MGVDYRGPESVVVCDEEGCDREHPNHRWGAVAAHDAGWFSTRDGEQDYCPAHVPDWVPAWREKRAAQKAANHQRNLDRKQARP